MCKTKKELESIVKELRSMKALKEETENAIKALELEVIGYLTSNAITEAITDTAKVTYKPQTRVTLDKERLEADLGSLTAYEKVSTYNVLRVK